jgi:hypothetical protein
MRRSAAVQPSQTWAPGKEQTRQRCGRSRSSTSSRYGSVCDVSVSAR